MQLTDNFLPVSLLFLQYLFKCLAHFKNKYSMKLIKSVVDGSPTQTHGERRWLSTQVTLNEAMKI